MEFIGTVERRASLEARKNPPEPLGRRRAIGGGTVRLSAPRARSAEPIRGLAPDFVQLPHMGETAQNLPRREALPFSRISDGLDCRDLE